MHQLASTKYELTGLENVISQYTARSSCARVILSSISAMKDGRVNARAIDINGHLNSIVREIGGYSWIIRTLQQQT